MPANWLLFLGIPALVASAWAIAKAIAGASDEPFAQRGYVFPNSSQITSNLITVTKYCDFVVSYLALLNAIGLRKNSLAVFLIENLAQK